MHSASSKKISRVERGFTIVELLIVIVVIAILAAITIVAYNGIQVRARDSQRLQDVRTITKALELYYIDNDAFPVGSGSTKINGSWSSTSDGSWANLETQLVPKYMSKLPQDPQANTANPPAISAGFNYDYVRISNSSWCNRPMMYMLTYRLEGSPQKREILGDCSSGTQPTDYASSEYMIIK